MNPLTIITALLPALQTAGPILAQLFPALIPALTGLSQVNPANHTSVVTLIQEVLNQLSAVGVIQLPRPLVVDGQFGGGTFAAVKLLQTKVGFGFLSVEPIASLEYTLLVGLFARF
jgi:hypothetical protein